MSPKNFNSNTVNNDEWLTPPELLQSLGPFDLDPCAPVHRPWDMAARHYTRNDNGLSLPWKGRVWLNPPYGREVFTWLDRLAAHRQGIALIFARTETRGFHSQIWQKAHAVFFFLGRLSFHYVDGRKGSTANAPSCLISYSLSDTEAIQRAMNMKNIHGKLVRL